MRALDKNGKIKIDEFIETFIQLDSNINRVIINNLDLDNRELFNLLYEISNDDARVSELKDIIDIGAFVKGKVQTVVDTDYIDKKVSEMVNDFSNGLDDVKADLIGTVEENFDPSRANSYTDKINKFFLQKKNEFSEDVEGSMLDIEKERNKLSKKIDSSFDPDNRTSYISRLMEFVSDFQKNISDEFDLEIEGSITNKLKELINETLSKDGKLISAIDNKFSFDNPDSTLVLLQNNLFQKIDQLREEVITTKSAAETEKGISEKTTIKGYDFENMLFENLEKFAKDNGDIVEDISLESGLIKGVKKGDFLYHVTRLNKSIAIEAKSRKMVTVKSLLETLDSTKENRKADYVIYISETEAQLNRQVGIFQEYLPDKIVTHFQLWAVALKVAISRLMVEHSEVEGIDRIAVENELNNIKNSLNSIRTIKAASTSIINESNRIKVQADQLKLDISSSIENLNEMIKT